MPSFESEICQNCPYVWQQHLSLPWHQQRDIVPLNVEDNGSDTLLVFQAPGEEEWAVARPLQPVVKQGGTAGRRVALSWQRKGRVRQQYDITNVVQCFPGKAGDGHDLEPDTAVTSCCSHWLRLLLHNISYRKVIVFGTIAGEVVKNLKIREGFQFELVRIDHPNGGQRRIELDALWEHAPGRRS